MDRHEGVISCFSVYVSHHYTRLSHLSHLSHCGCTVTDWSLSAVLHKILAPLYHIQWWTETSQVSPWRWRRSHTAWKSVHARERQASTHFLHMCTPQSRNFNHERLLNWDFLNSSQFFANSGALTLFLWCVWSDVSSVPRSQLYVLLVISSCEDGRDTYDGGFILSCYTRRLVKGVRRNIRAWKEAQLAHVAIWRTKYLWSALKKQTNKQINVFNKYNIVNTIILFNIQYLLIDKSIRYSGSRSFLDLVPGFRSFLVSLDISHGFPFLALAARPPACCTDFN